MKKSILSLSATVLLLASCGGGMSFEDAAKWIESHYVGDQRLYVEKLQWEWDFSMVKNGSLACDFAVQIISQQTHYDVRYVEDLKHSITVEVGGEQYVDKLTVNVFRSRYDKSVDPDINYTFKVEQDCFAASGERNQSGDGVSAKIVGRDNYDKDGFQITMTLETPKCTFPDGSNCNGGFLKRTTIFVAN